MDNTPTELTVEDINNTLQKLLDDEIREKHCTVCNKGFYLQSYGYLFGECDECYFSRFPKEQVEKFYRSFF